MTFFTRKRILISIAVLALVGAAAYYQRTQNKPKDDESKFRTALVDMGNITQTVTASGTLNQGNW